MATPVFVFVIDEKLGVFEEVEGVVTEGEGCWGVDFRKQGGGGNLVSWNSMIWCAVEVNEVCLTGMLST